MTKTPSKSYLWDYDYDELQKTASGRRLILERMINYGPGKDKISLSAVKKEWNNLQLEPKQRNLMEFLIWKKLPS